VLVVGVFANPMEVHHVAQNDDGIDTFVYTVVYSSGERTLIVVWAVDVRKHKDVSATAYGEVSLALLVVTLRNRMTHWIAI
jgi:hypothetical protein